MSDPHLDDVLRHLGDHGLDPDDRAAAVARVGRRVQRDLAAPGAPGRRPRLLVAVTAALATAATFTATAAVALTAATGSPVPDFARGDTTNVFPDAGTTRITDVRSADPGGGPAWTVRVGRTENGLVCIGAGQVAADGTFGIRGLDGVFRPVAPFGNDPCGPAPRTGRPLVQLRGFSGPGARTAAGATSVVHGAGGAGLRDVQVATAAGRPRAVPVGASGTFVLAVPGLPEGAAPEVRLRWDDGTERTVRLGRNVSVPDPGGRVGWSASTAYSGPTGCVLAQVLRVEVLDGGARVCGPLAGSQATLVAVRPMHGVGARRALLVRRDGGDRVTVRLGGREVPTVTVRMAGRLRTRRIRVLERGRMVDRTERLPGPGPAASLAILPDGTRPQDLEVRAVRDGHTRTLSVTPNGGR